MGIAYKHCSRTDGESAPTNECAILGSTYEWFVVDYLQFMNVKSSRNVSSESGYSFVSHHVRESPNLRGRQTVGNLVKRRSCNGVLAVH